MRGCRRAQHRSGLPGGQAPARPDPDWTGWFTRDGVDLARPGAYEPPEGRAAFTALADALAQALPADALRPQPDMAVGLP